MIGSCLVTAVFLSVAVVLAEEDNDEGPLVPSVCPLDNFPAAVVVAVAAAASSACFFLCRRTALTTAVCKIS